MAISRDGAGNALYPAANYKEYEDTSFVTGESPVTLDFNTALGRNANNGYIINDGAGNFTFALTQEGTNYGDSITLKAGEEFSLKGRDIDSLKITWIADSAYRVFVE